MPTDANAHPDAASVFYQIAEYPQRLQATTALVRLVDGLGFRFLWATAGLDAQDAEFRPAADVKSIGELTDHIVCMMARVARAVGPLPEEADSVAGFATTRAAVLDVLATLRRRLLELDDAALAEARVRGRPVWHAINGQLADALTHVGQIVSFRRIASKPQQARVNVFLGIPPQPDA